jgi:predicted permease
MLLEHTINIFGNATAASTLFITGVVVSSQTLRFDIAVLISASIKNLFQPAIALALALLFHLPTASEREVVLICAVPCGFFGLIFGKSFSATSETASSCLVISCVSSALTLAITVVFLGTLN